MKLREVTILCCGNLLVFHYDTTVICSDCKKEWRIVLVWDDKSASEHWEGKSNDLVFKIEQVCN